MEITRIPEVEAHIDQQEGNEVYRFMRNKFDEVSDFYSEEHDEEIAGMTEEFFNSVSKEASEHYGITSDEAGNIYTRIEVSLSPIYQQFAKEARK